MAKRVIFNVMGTHSLNPVFTDVLQPKPTGAELKAARLAAKLTQPAAAELIGVKMRTLQDWEAGIAAMPLAAWALFLLATDKHSRYRLKQR